MKRRKYNKPVSYYVGKKFETRHDYRDDSGTVIQAGTVVEVVGSEGRGRHCAILFKLNDKSWTRNVSARRRDLFFRDIVHET